MKFASFARKDEHPTWGALVNDQLIDLGESGRHVAPTLMAALAADALPNSVERHDGDSVYSPADVRFLPVIPEPSKILCIGVNYRSHQEETGKRADAPTVFSRYADSQMGHDQAAIYPRCSEQFDYEGELAVVVSKETYRVNREDAWSHIAGVAPYNDFSVRDWQRAASQWLPGKTFVGTGGFGPFLVTVDEIENFDAIELTTRVNGEVRQHAKLADLDFSVEELIEYTSTFTPLKAGDVIVTGTPGGVGLFRNPPALLEDGDTVEVELSGVGILRNTVEREPAE